MLYPTWVLFSFRIEMLFIVYVTCLFLKRALLIETIFITRQSFLS